MSHKLEHDAQTGENVKRELNKVEVEQREKDLAKHAALAEALEQDNLVRAAKRQQALDKLGLTADEAAALFG